MLSSDDVRNGLIKITWQNVRDRVAKIEPTFAKIVDEIDPGPSFLLFLAYYPYGATKGDTKSTLFPRSDGSYYRLTDPDAQKEVVTHLGYSKNNAPFA